MTITSSFNKLISPADSSMDRPTNDLRYTNLVLVPALIISLIILIGRLGFYTETATALLWAFAGLAAGTAVGFLFGIPKILQTNSQTATGSSSSANEQRNLYRQQVNTNLTEISDWLTKIIVGLGLVNLAKIPPYANRIANVMAASLGGPADSQKGFALAILLYFPILGFFFGYLYTRLFLAEAFLRADQRSTQSKIEQLVEAEVQAKENNANLQGNERRPSGRELEAAKKVAQLATQKDAPAVRQQLIGFSQEYERIRAVMGPGDERTRQMEIIVTKMRTLALAGYKLLPEFSKSQVAGERLVAVAMLQVQSDVTYADWLADRVDQERPFVGYHASVALLYAIRTLTDATHQLQVCQAVNKAIEFLGKNIQTDRYKVLEEARKECNTQD